MTTVEVRHSPCLSSQSDLSPLASREVTPRLERASREATDSPCLVRATDGHSNDSDMDEGW